MRSIIPAIVLAAATFCQTPGQPSNQVRPEFEVASVKPTAVGNPEQINVGVRIDGAMVMIHSFTLRDYIALAFQVKDPQITGPEWMASAKFDLNAKIPEGAPRSQLPAMLQALLEERFKLASHREKKESQVYVLAVAKGGPKLKESSPDAEAKQDPSKANIDVSANGGGRGGAVINLGNGSFISNGNGHIEGRKVTIPQLLDSVGRFLDHPAIDTTGLTGHYDVSLAYGVDELRTMLKNVGADRPIPDDALPAGASLFESLKVVGLTLDARKGPLEMVIIDHIEKSPIAN